MSSSDRNGQRSAWTSVLPTLQFFCCLSVVASARQAQPTQNCPAAPRLKPMHFEPADIPMLSLPQAMQDHIPQQNDETLSNDETDPGDYE